MLNQPYISVPLFMCWTPRSAVPASRNLHSPLLSSSTEKILSFTIKTHNCLTMERVFYHGENPVGGRELAVIGFLPKEEFQRQWGSEAPAGGINSRWLGHSFKLFTVWKILFIIRISTWVFSFFSLFRYLPCFSFFDFLSLYVFFFSSFGSDSVSRRKIPRLLRIRTNLKP